MNQKPIGTLVKIKDEFKDHYFADGNGKVLDSGADHAYVDFGTCRISVPWAHLEPVDTEVTPEMEEVGEKMFNALQLMQTYTYQLCIELAGGVGGNDDLMRQVDDDGMTSAKAIYLAMERART